MAIKLRKEVREFSDEMEKALQANDHKGGWHDMEPDEVIRRIREETDELEDKVNEAVYNDDLPTIESIRKEAADVANFAMFAADNMARLLEKRAAEQAKQKAEDAEE